MTTAREKCEKCNNKRGCDAMQNTFQALSVFVRTVEMSSFVNAARSLLVDSATVSRTIKALEADLGVLLFRRSTRTVKLTTEGARFYRDSVQLLDALERATVQFRARGDGPRGEIKVGMALGVSRRMVMRVVPGFQRLYPEVEIVLLNIDDLAQVGQKAVDVFVRPRSLRRQGGQHAERQGMVVRTLAQSRFVTCATPQYLHRFGAPRVPADLLHHSCIAHLTIERDVQNEWVFVKSQLREKVRTVPKLFIQGTDALREAALAHCGIIRTVAYVMDEELRSGKLQPVLADWDCPGAPPMVAIYRKTKPMPRAVGALVQHLAREFQAIARKAT
jgi:LysR family transcriptional regulator for bpeEF and oprC